MQQTLHRSSLVPRGFDVEGAYYDSDKAVIVVRATGNVGLCPSCGTVSILRRQVGDRRLFPDHELQLGKEVDDELTIRAQCLEQAVPPPAERLLALGEERADKALEGLAHRRV